MIGLKRRDAIHSKSLQPEGCFTGIDRREDGIDIRSVTDRSPALGRQLENIRSVHGLTLPLAVGNSNRPGRQAVQFLIGIVLGMASVLAALCQVPAGDWR